MKLDKAVVDKYIYRYRTLNDNFNRIFNVIKNSVPTFQDYIFQNKHPLNEYHGFTNPDIFYIPRLSSWFTVLSTLSLWGYIVTAIDRYFYKYNVSTGRWERTLLHIYRLSTKYFPVILYVYDTSNRWIKAYWIYFSDIRTVTVPDESLYASIKATPYFSLTVQKVNSKYDFKENIKEMLSGLVDIDTFIVSVNDTVQTLPPFITAGPTVYYTNTEIRHKHNSGIKTVVAS